MLREMTAADYATAEALIARINRTSVKYFLEAYGTDRFSGYIYSSLDEQGVVSVIEEEEFFLVQVSCTGNPDKAELITDIHSVVKGILQRKGERDFYLNFYGGNKTLISYFREHGFRSDMTGYQFRYQARQFPGLPDLGARGLTARPFELEHVDRYLAVIDDAFRPLDLACGLPANRAQNNKERITARLQELDQKGEFATFWRGEELMGVYLLTGDWIYVVAVSPEFQNQGTGSLILLHALDRLFNEKHYPEVFLNCLEINPQGLHYYQKNGFEVVGYFSENTYQPAS